MRHNPAHAVCSDTSTVSVSEILYSRTTGVETWITSDGRAYFVRLNEPASSAPEEPYSDAPLSASASASASVSTHGEDVRSVSDDKSQSPQPLQDPEPVARSMWSGTCIHNYQSPRWVEKQRSIDPTQPLHQRERRVYVEPKRATAVAINGKFSMLAIGMLGYVTTSDQDPSLNVKSCSAVPLISPTFLHGKVWFTLRYRFRFRIRITKSWDRFAVWSGALMDMSLLLDGNMAGPYLVLEEGV